jgi:DNA-binding transcriptional ArsR family regulator
MTFVSHVTLAEVGALLGDVSRSAMLAALMDGRAWTAKELAAEAGVAASTASEHLSKLLDGGLIHGVRQGRHRYFRLKSPRIAALLEQLMQLRALEPQARRRPPSRLDDETRFARVCYDHFAGRFGVGLMEALVQHGHVDLDLEADSACLTPSGIALLSGLGIGLASIERRQRAVCRPCLDWSERAPHLAGAVGAELAALFFRRGWVERRKLGRSVAITDPGWAALGEHFGLARLALETRQTKPIRWI